MNEAHSAWISQDRRHWIRQLRNQLGAYFATRGLPVSRKYGYILADRDHWRNNIIDPRVADFVVELQADRQRQGRPFPLHKYIHHGLSSQALLFNLLGPIIVNNQWDIFDLILQKAGINLKGNVLSTDLEIEDRSVFKESRGQPTSVDLLCKTDADERVYVEFKFTEAEFGGCSVFEQGNCDGRNPAANFDLCYLHALDRQYWPLMEKHGMLTNTVRAESRCPFMDLYQAYRVLLFALEKGGCLLLMHDARNPSFVVQTPRLRRGLFVRFKEALPIEARARCYSITHQEIVAIIKRQGNIDWLGELEEKYFKEQEEEI
jgi:hypothetical protein